MVITQADKGKTIVIINSNEYSEKLHSFLNAKNFNILTKDPIKKFHNLIHKTVQESNLIIDKKQIKLLTQKKANIKQLLDTKSIALYVRYVDEILVIYDATKINLHTINTYINKIHNNIKLNPTNEEHNSVAFLNLTKHADTPDLKQTYTGNQPVQTQQLTFYLITP